MMVHRLLLLAGLLAAPLGASDGEPAGKPVVVQGCVEAGVEGGCKMLVTDAGERYNILGEGLPEPGTRVRVTGELRNMATICMQGKPLIVKKVTKLTTPCPKR